MKTNVSKLPRHENKSRTFDNPTPRELPKVRLDRRVARPGVIGGGDHPDPLRSNPNVTSFALPPEQISLPDSDDDEAHTIQEGFGVSDSTGDLSYFTRTPSPQIAKILDSGMVKPRVLEETPTKQPTFGRLKKSVSGFFIKSASKMRHVSSTSRQAQIQEESEQQNASPATVEVPEPITPAKPVIYDHQPFTPSPLRHSSRPDVSEDGQVSRERATTVSSTAQLPEGGLKPSQSRSPTTAADQEKRRAMYGHEFEGINFRQSRIDSTEPYEG